MTAFDWRWTRRNTEPLSVSPRKQRRRTFGFFPLEPRIMFDAAAVATAAADVAASDPASSGQPGGASDAVQTPPPSEPAAPPANAASTPTAADSDDASALPVPQDATATNADSAIREIVIFDSHVPDLQTLIDGVKPGTQVFVLDPNRDGVQQIADIVAANNLHDLSAIQIVAHGSTGEIQLGTTRLTDATAADYAQALAAIGAALSDSGDILLYGCDVGRDAAGQQFLAHLSQLTGADVAAATHDVGSAQGRTWVLDTATGPIEAGLPFGAAALAAYQGTLAPTSAQLFFITQGSGVDNAIKYVNSDGTIATNLATGGPSGTNTSLISPFDIAVDTAAGLFFVIDPQSANGPSGQLQIGNLATPNAALGTAEYTVPNTFGRIDAIAIDPSTHTIYLSQVVYNAGVTALDNRTGIIALTYNPATGAIVGGPTYLVTRGQPGSLATDANIDPLLSDLSFDPVNRILYYTDDSLGGAYNVGATETNRVMAFNLNTNTLTTVATFPSAPDSDPLHAGTDYPELYTQGTIAGVAANPTDNLVFFSTGHGVFSPGSANTIYLVTASGTGLVALNEALAFDGMAPMHLEFDDSANQLYVSYSHSSTAGALVRYNVNGLTPGSTSGVTLSDPVSFNLNLANAPGFATYPEGLSLNEVPLLTLTGTATQVVEQGAAVDLTAALTLADDGGYLRGATVQITGGTFSGDGDVLAANVAGTSITANYVSATRTLTLSGYDTIANYQTVLGAVTFTSTGDNPTNNGANTTRTLTWQVNDGALGDPFSAALNQKTTTVAIEAVDDPPAFTSGTTATAAEGTSTSTTVYTAAATDPDTAGAVTFSITGGADASRFSINSASGAVTFNAAPNFEAPTDVGANNVYDITITASTVGGTATSTQDVAITVTNVAPTFTSGTTVSAAEGTSTSTAVYTATATDPAGGSLIYSLAGADANRFNINSSTGAVTFIATPNFEVPTDAGADNVYNITVQASDGSVTVTRAVAITVTNLAPVISSGTSASVNEGVAAGSTVYAAVAADPAGGTVAYSLVAGGDSAAFSINSSTGAVTINNSPDFETKSSYSFTVLASDPSGAFSTQTVTLGVNDLAPVISSGTSASVNEGVAAGSTVYTAVAADPAGGTVTYALVAGGDAAAFTIDSSTGVVTINNAPDFESKSSYNFTVRASDPSNAFSTQAVTLSVNNLAPVITSAATASVNENVAAGATVYTAVAADPAGGTVTYALTGTDAAAFTIDSSTGVVTINNSPDFEIKNSYSFTIRASDSSNAFSTRAVTLSVANVNEAPSGADNTVTTNEDVAYTFTATDFGFTDPDDTPANSLAAVRIGSLPAEGNLRFNGVAITQAQVTAGLEVSAADITAGLLTFLAAANANGAGYASFTFQVRDNGGTAPGVDLDQSPNAITINVTAVNDAPVATITPASYSATEQTSLTLKGTGLSVSDADALGGIVTITLSVGEGTLSATAGDSGATIDSGNNSSSVQMSGTLAQLNALLGAGSTSTLTYINSSDTPSTSTTLTLAVNDNGNTGTPGAQTGQDTATINITAVNDAPTVDAPASLLGLPNVAFAITGITFADADAGGATATFTAGAGILTATTTATVTVSGSGTGTLTLTGTIADLNDFIAGNGLTFASAASTSIQVDLDDLGNTGTPGPQTGSDTIAIVIDIPPVLAGAGNTVGYTEQQIAPAAVVLAPAIMLTDSDAPGSGTQINSATVQITAGGIVGDTLAVGTLPGGSAASYDGGTFTLTLTGGASLADYQAALRSVTFSSSSDDPTAAGASTSRTVSWTAFDIFDVASTAATTTVNVTAVNDAPVNTVPGAQTTGEDTSLVFAGPTAIGIADMDSGSQGVTVALSVLHGSLTFGGSSAGLTSFSNGQPSISLSGSVAAINTALATLSYQPADDYHGADTLTLATTDNGHTGGGALTDADTVAITINAVADAVTDNLTTNEDTPVAVNVITGTNGASADNFEDTGRTLTAVTQGANGTVTFAGTGTVTYTPDPDFNGSDSFTYTVTTVDGATETGTVNVTVNAVADIVADNLTTDEDTPVMANVITGTDGASADNFEDAGRVLTAVTQGANGTVTFAAGGSITYSPNADFFGADSFTYTVTSGGVTETVTVNVTVNSVNDAPMVVVSDVRATYTEQVATSAIGLDIFLSDVDSTSLTGATATISGGAQPGDTLLFQDQSGITGVFSGNALVLTGVATVAEYEAALRSVRFENLTNDNPTNSSLDPTRTISWTVTDGAATSTAVTSFVDIVAVNDPAVISGASAGSVTEAGGIANANVNNHIATGTLVAADPDNTNTFQPVTGAAASDNGYGTFTLMAGGTWIFTLDNSNAAVQALQAGDTLTDTFTVLSNDGTAQLVTVTINGANDAPVVTAVNTADYDTESRDTVILAPAITITDVDSPILSGATVSISTAFASGDQLHFTDQNGITGRYDPATGILTLSGTASVAAYQAALASVAFSTVAPDSNSRTVTWVVYDGGAQGHQSAVATTTLNVSGPIELPKLGANDPSGTGSQNEQSFNVPTFNRFISLGAPGDTPGVFQIVGFNFQGGGPNSSFQVSLAALESSLAGPAVEVAALLANGEPLPNWIRFDPATGTFTVQLPPGTVASFQAADDSIVTGSIPPDPGAGDPTQKPDNAQEIVVEVQVRDAAGNTAVMRILIKLSKDPAQLIDAPGRQGWHLGPKLDATIEPRDVSFDARYMLTRLGLHAFSDGAAIHQDAPVRGDSDGISLREAPMGRSGLTQQLGGFGWRAMQQDRLALLKSLPPGSDSRPY